MRFMYDSVTASDIPVSARMVAGYVNGHFQWSDADWARFPDAVKVRIATQANVNDGHVLDVEQGDATPTQAPGWVARRRAAGVDPSVYCSQAAWLSVWNAFVQAGVPQPHYWIAHFDNSPVIPQGAVAKQYADAGLAGGHYDLSIVEDVWPGVDIAPIPIDPEETMYTFVLPANPTGGRFALTLPVSRQCEVTLSCDGEATLTEYGWVSPQGGNGFSEKNVALHDQGAHSFRPDKGTGKVDIQYTSNATINGVVDVIG